MVASSPPASKSTDEGAYILLNEGTYILLSRFVYFLTFSGTYFDLKSILSEHSGPHNLQRPPLLHSGSGPSCGCARSAVMALETHASPAQAPALAAPALRTPQPSQSPIGALPPPGLRESVSWTPILQAVSGMDNIPSDSEAKVKSTETNVRTDPDPSVQIASNMLLTRRLLRFPPLSLCHPTSIAVDDHDRSKPL